MNYKRLLEKEIDDYYAEKCSGAYVRSGSVWLEKGEKSTSYFLNLEKRQQTNNAINKIKDENGIEYTTTTEIIDVLMNFYDKLYTSNDIDIVDIQNYLDSINCGKISDNEKEMCDEIPTLNECKTAVENMKNNKSPGQDGLPAEFDK